MFDYIVASDLRYEWAYLMQCAFASFQLKSEYVVSPSLLANASASTLALFSAFEALPEKHTEIDFLILWQKLICNDVEAFDNMLDQYVIRLESTIFAGKAQAQLAQVVQGR